jgi:uncharacterized protein RhaS with RHS repeats
MRRAHRSVTPQRSTSDYLNNRYLDPTLGRFISVDPLVSLTGDAYAYGANNPVTMTDPSGLFPCFGICDLAQAAWQVTATTVVYEYDVARRYANDPGQAVKDVVTGTAFAEQTWAGINIRAGATLKRDGEYCSGAANCFVNDLSPKDATTIGHTEAYSDAKPGDALIAHETQHVSTLKTMGRSSSTAFTLASRPGGG